MENRMREVRGIIPKGKAIARKVVGLKRKSIDLIDSVTPKVRECRPQRMQAKNEKH